MRALAYIISLMFWVMKDKVEQPEVNNMDLELEKMYQMWYEQQTQNPEPPADDGSSFITENALFLSIFLLLPLLSYKKWSNRSKIQIPELGFDAEDYISKINKEPEKIRSNQWKRLLKIRRKSPNMKPRWSKTLSSFCSMKGMELCVYFLRCWRKMIERKSRAVNKPKKQHPVTARKTNNKPKIDFNKLGKNLLFWKKKKCLSKKKDSSHKIRPTVCPRLSASSESIKCPPAASPAKKAHTYRPVCRSFMFSEQKLCLEKHIIFKDIEIQFEVFPKIFTQSQKMYEQSLLNSSASKEDYVPPVSPAKKTYTYQPVCRSFMFSEHKLHLIKHIIFKDTEIQFKVFPKIFTESQKMYEQSLLNSSASKNFVPPLSPAKKTHTYQPVCRRFMFSKHKLYLENDIRIKRFEIQYELFPKIFTESQKMYEQSLLNSSESREDLVPLAIITSKSHYSWKWLHSDWLPFSSTGRVHEEDWEEKFKAYLAEMKEQLRSIKHAAKTIWRSQRLTLWFQSMMEMLNTCMKTNIRREST